MEYKRTIFIILIFVSILATAIAITSSGSLMKLNFNKNIAVTINENFEQQINKETWDSISNSKYLIIYDSEQEHLMECKKYIENILDYTKKEYGILKVEDVVQMSHDYDAVIMVIDNMNKLKDVNSLMTYIAEGGNVFFPYRLEKEGNFQSISSKLGIKDFGDYVDSVGIRLTDNVMLKGTGVEIAERRLIENSSLMVELMDDCKSYAESIDGTNLLWTRKYGQGNIVYFNGTMLDDKTGKGFIAGSLSLLEEDYIYPIMNIKISYIDDFPAPFPLGRHKVITKEFDGTVSEFYRDVWWPDMLVLAHQYNVLYTSVIIGTYNDDVENVSPDGFELQMKDLVYYGREVLNAGGEIGIHGYNHQPFATQELVDKGLGYKPWKNQEMIIKSLQEVNRLAKKAFPNYTFRVYVPPSNILYPEGKQAILDSDTDIKIIASVHNGDGDPDSYVQEFQESPEGIIELPRLTYGYMNTDENRWGILSGITAYGYFGHFVHPDDLLADDRNYDLGWKKLFGSYEEMNKNLFDNYGWLRPVTASNGANEMIKYLRCEPKYEKKDNYMKIYCNHFFDEAYFLLRTVKEIESFEDCDVKKVDKDIYLIKMNEPVSQINYSR